MKIKLLLSLVLVVLLTATMAVATNPTAKRCTLDLPILGIDNYEWIETNYPATNDEEIAYTVCKKVAELAGDKLCHISTCVKYIMDWSPGTGAYGLLVHSSSIGHSHSYGNCNGGNENFIFGYNYDNHQRGGHCSYPTAPGKIDWYHSGTYRGCHEDGAGSFSCEDMNPYCGDDVCSEDEDYNNCPEECNEPNYYTKEETDSMITNLQGQIDMCNQKQQEQDDEINSLTESQEEQSNIIEELRTSFNAFVEKVMDYFGYLSFSARKRIVCGSMAEEGLEQKTDLGLSCELSGNGNACRCERI